MSDPVIVMPPNRNLEPDVLAIARQMLPSGFELRLVPTERLAEALRDADYLMGFIGPLDDATLAGAPRLRLVQFLSVGLDQLQPGRGTSRPAAGRRQRRRQRDRRRRARHPAHDGDSPAPHRPRRRRAGRTLEHRGEAPVRTVELHRRNRGHGPHRSGGCPPPPGVGVDRALLRPNPAGAGARAGARHRLGVAGGPPRSRRRGHRPRAPLEQYPPLDRRAGTRPDEADGGPGQHGSPASWSTRLPWPRPSGAGASEVPVSTSCRPSPRRATVRYSRPPTPS